MKRQRRFLVLAAGLVLALGNLAGCQAAGDPVAAYRTPAHFRVSNAVVSKNLEPFAATIPGIGNSLLDIMVSNSGFEPIVYRNMYPAQENSPDRVAVAPTALSQHDTLREGFLDGAEVRVYRIENGRFDVVREDRIAEGGFHVSSWLPAFPGSKLVPAANPSFNFRWDGYNRPDARYYFTVRAIDRAGKMSPPATAVSFDRPANTGKKAAETPLVEFRPPRSPAGGTPPPPPAPGNLRGHPQLDGSLLLEWDPVKTPDLVGYIVYRSDYPPERHAGYFLQLSSQAASPRQHIRAGDLVVVSKKFYSASRNRMFSNRVWGSEGETSMLLPSTIGFFPDENPAKTWELVRHEIDSPVENRGETCLKLTLAPGTREIVGLYNHSGKAQTWYPVLEQRSYRVEAWMRQEGSGSVRFKFDGFHGAKPNAIEPIVFDVGTRWKKYVGTFTPPAVQDNATPGRMALEFSGPGTFYVDNFRVYRADTDYLDYLPSQYADIKSSGLSALRAHGLVKTKFRTYDMAQLTNDGGGVSGTMAGNTLPQLLRAIRKTGKRPWLQIEFHMGPREWLAFIEYMAAPYDPAIDSPTTKPWAYKRYLQGQARPWVEEFDQILFELGNETWNRIFQPWIFSGMADATNGKAYTAGQVYGLFQEHVIGVMRSSPYWHSARLDDKFAFVLGGWGGLPYGREAADISPSSHYLTIAAYNGGWDEGEGPPRLDAPSLFNVLSQVNQSAIPVAEGHLRELRDLNARRKNPLRLGTYEAGPGYALNGLNNARISEAQSREQEQVMKSLAAGTATLDSFLARAYRGFDLQNFFGFRSGSHWASHAPWYRGGQAYPAWQLLSLFNNQGTGDMLRTDTLSVPVADLKPYERRKGVSNAPLAAVYATRRGNRHVIVVISRKIAGYPFAGDDGFTLVTIDLPFARAKRLTLYRMAGDPRSNNLLSPHNVKIDKVEIGEWGKSRLTLDAALGADERGLPPASTFMYVFEETAGMIAD
ncbi:MAG: glycoside hydrolase family protein [Rhodocyclaceae bacterium]|nr:MAG: glycoside hydrolase family protein [Rhodocyclaceae bacterium]TNC98422.1 MAG: glycoside hydrolase family protein [Rhodocyclaceae bacterium]